MGNSWVSTSISRSTGKCNKTYHIGRTWEFVTHTFPIVWANFSNLFPKLYYTSLHGKCMGFQTISHSTEKRNKTHRMGEHGKLVLILFPQYKCFFLMRFPSYIVLHHMGNACVSPSIPHSIRQCSEIL